MGVVSRNVIVLCGKTPLSTEKAVERFLAEYVHAGTGEFDQTLFKTEETLYQQDYPYESVTLYDIALDDYVIAIQDAGEAMTAYRLAHMIGAYSGELADVVKYEELTPAHRGVICLSSNGRNPETPWPKDLDGYFLNLETDEAGVTLSVLWTKEDYFEAAMTRFSERFVVSGEAAVGVARFTSITQHDLPGKNLVNETEWKVVSQIERPLADGAMQVSYTCSGYQKIPYLVHVMTADLNKVDLMLGTADNRNNKEDQWTHTPLQHALSAEKAGHHVLGGINAGYPEGLSVKEGKMMVKGTLHRPYFAITKSGEAVILYDDNAADISNLEMAACGTDVIIDNYMPTDLQMAKEFNYTAHPRTLIGIRGDGAVVMVVIDGRQKEISNGAPFTRCADIMMKLGCKYALNLDGGGSSTMIVRTNTEGTLRAQAVNQISDSTMRKVRNSILVIAKED